MVGKHIGSVLAARHHIGYCEAERVDCSVRHLYGSDNVGVYRRLDAHRILGVDGFGIDAGLQARFDKCLLICKVILREGDEKSAGVFHTVACDTAENHILLDALCCRFLIGHRIAGAAVQQAVVASGCAGGKVETFYEERFQTTHGAVAGSPGACGTSAYHNHVVVCLSVVVVHDQVYMRWFNNL